MSSRRARHAIRRSLGRPGGPRGCSPQPALRRRTAPTARVARARPGWDSCCDAVGSRVTRASLARSRSWPTWLMWWRLRSGSAALPPSSSRSSGPVRRWQLAASAVPRFSPLAVGAVAVLLIAARRRLPGGAGTARALGDDLRPTPARQGRARPAAARARPLQQPPRRPPASGRPRLGSGTHAFPSHGRRRARPDGRDRQRHRSSRLRAAGTRRGRPDAGRTRRPPRSASSNSTSSSTRPRPEQRDPSLPHRPLGQPPDVDEASVAASLASRGIGPLRFTAHRAGPGHFVVHGAHLALAGDWQLRLEAAVASSTRHANRLHSDQKGTH